VLNGPRGQETVAVSGRFAANEMQAVLAAAIAGYGIAQLPYRVSRALRTAIRKPSAFGKILLTEWRSERSSGHGQACRALCPRFDWAGASRLWFVFNPNASQFNASEV
jgi:DNA-binding transcriptional LysR family regulator